MAAAKKEKKDSKQKSQPSGGGLNAFLKEVGIILGTFLLLNSFVLASFEVPTGSMENEIMTGDFLLVNKFIFGGTGAAYEKFLPYRPIRRGDILVFKFPYGDHTHFVKRVIGLPGDRIKIVDKQVYVNGLPLLEPYKVQDPGELYDSFGANFPPTSRHFLHRNVQPEWGEVILDHVEGGELVVPPNRYFVMGDNRDNSLDSRYWGFVDRGAVMGRPIVIYWSVEATTADYSDRSLGGRIIGLLDTLIHLPMKTRWSRMFRGVH